MKRVFAAIDISEEAREAVRSYVTELRREFEGVPVKWEKPEKLHITLFFAGNVNEDEFSTLKERVRKAALQFQPFEIVVTRTGAFTKRSKPSILWLGLESYNESNGPGCIERVASLICNASANGRFNPHLTIARIKDPSKMRALVENHLASDFGTVEFRASEIVIYESTLLPTGSVYSRLDSFKLAG